MYTKPQLESVCGLGTVTGLCGANCYHSYSPFVHGVSKRQYTDDELDRMNAEENTPKEYNGKQYTKHEALQKQRRMETVMRAQRQKIKLLENGGADEDDIIAARCKYRGTSAEYARFSKAMNLKQQRDRITVDGLGNIGVGKWKKHVEKIKLDDIIDLEDKKIKSILKSGKINTSIIDGKQGKHIKGHNNYQEGKSYLTIPQDEAQNLVNKLRGTGYLIRDRKGKWRKQEVVVADRLIGVEVSDLDGMETPTKAFKIHYSNNGVHIVPKKE